MAIISFMEFIESAASSTVCDNTINGECCQCGECCGNYLPLSKKEIREIHQYIKANDIKECNNMVPLSEVLFDLTCPFLDTRKSNEKCRIYEVRPEICKVFACNKTHLEMMSPELMEGNRIKTNMREEFFHKN